MTDQTPIKQDTATHSTIAAAPKPPATDIDPNEIPYGGPVQ